MLFSFLPVSDNDHGTGSVPSIHEVDGDLTHRLCPVLISTGIHVSTAGLANPLE